MSERETETGLREKAFRIADVDGAYMAVRLKDAEAAIEAAVQHERNRCDALVQKARFTPADLRSISSMIRSGLEVE